jgi:hypothetical protein
MHKRHTHTHTPTNVKKREIDRQAAQMEWEEEGGGGRHLGADAGALSQQGAGDEPHAIGHGELVDGRLLLPRPRVVPLVRRHSGQRVQRETGHEEGGHHHQPNVQAQWVHERKERRLFVRRHLSRTKKPPKNNLRVRHLTKMALENLKF